MRLDEFLQMHKNGCVECVSIHLLPYDTKKHCYTKTYFEEGRQEDLMETARYRAIKNREVDHFNVIGGGMYPMELCVFLKEN